MIAKQHAPSWDHNTGQLGDHTSGHRDVVQAESSDRAVEARFA
jgi:hypothetical protein